ncbi:Uma2 family endonuclease [Streptomyces parvus]|uniref:Uma2 family endonuclease n=1 Tax=Streptomyces parvus TaxID=66428 RepID=UPI0035E16F23
MTAPRDERLKYLSCISSSCDGGSGKNDERAGLHQGIDAERALKFAVQHIRGDRVEIIEAVSPTWDHESAAKVVRRQIEDRVDELSYVEGSGNLDLPGSSNWYVPDIAVVPEGLARGGGALLPDQTLLIVGVTSESNADTDRIVKRRRYGAPLYLLVDRMGNSLPPFSEPGQLGYTRVDGPPALRYHFSPAGPVQHRHRHDRPRIMRRHPPWSGRGWQPRRIAELDARLFVLLRQGWRSSPGAAEDRNIGSARMS